MPKLKPTDTIIQLARSELLDELSGPQLVVYLRILAAAGRAGKAKVAPTNAELYERDPRTAVKALRELERRKLVVVTYDRTTRPGRSIEVRR